jgi:alkylation response protein AidB-like acyl-CoA dehydrogenase
MPIGITDEQESLRQSVHGWIARHCPPAVPRRLLDAEREELPPFWSELASQGWLGLHVDEAYGGEGYGLTELAVVIEELGRAVAPGPFVATVLAAAVIQAAGKEVGAALLPDLARGEAIGAVALEGALDAEATGEGRGGRGPARWSPSRVGCPTS